MTPDADVQEMTVEQALDFLRAAVTARDAEIARLRAVLLSIAVLGDDLPAAMPDYMSQPISVGYLRKARAALTARR